MSRIPRARTTLLVLFAINLLNFYDRQILAVVSEPIRKEFMWGDGALGWLNTAFVLLYAAIGLPLGRWSDMGKRVKLLAGGLAVWSVFTGLSGLARGYWTMFLARIGVGVGEAACSPASNSLLGDLYPATQRARAISVFMLGLPLGIFLSNLLSGIIARDFGWRMSFFAAAVPGLLLVLVVRRLPEPVRGGVDGTAAARALPVATTGFWAPFLALMKIPTLRWIVISGALQNFNVYAVNAFLPAYLMRWHKLSLAQVGFVSAMVLGASGLVSLVVGGIVADKLHHWRRDGRLLFASVAIALHAPLLYVALALPQGEVTAFAWLVGIAWLLFYVYYATVYAAIHDVVPAELRGSAMSLYFFWMYVLGGAFGTAILGMISDRAAKGAMVAAGATEMTEAVRATGLHDAFGIVPVLGIALAVLLFMASRTIGKDIDALKSAAPV